VSLWQRLVRIAAVRRLGLALAVLCIGCSAFGKGATGPELTQREVARGAVAGLAWGVRLSVEVCARAIVALDNVEDKRADALYETCADGWDVAHAALVAADAIIDAKEAWDAGKVACLANRALEALGGIMTGLRKVGATLPDDVQATIDDGIALGRYLIRLAPGGSCPLPITPKPTAAPAPTVAPSQVLFVTRGNVLFVRAVLS
jgi:hypothetical protein